MKAIIKISIMLLIFFNIFNQVYAWQPAQQQQRTHLFDTYLNKATYGDEKYENRIQIYKQLLPLVASGVSDTQKTTFSNILSGLFKTRQQDNSSNLRLLKEFYKMSADNSALKDQKTEIEGWVSVINKEIVNFALCDGDIIKINSDQNNVDFICYQNALSGQSYFDIGIKPLQQEEVLQAPRFFKIKSKSGKQGALLYGDEIELIPLYLQRASFVYPLIGNGKLGILTSSHRGQNLHKLKVGTNLNTPFVFKPNIYHAKNETAEPILPDDIIEIWSKLPYKRIVVDANSNLSFDDGKPIAPKNSSFKVQKVSPQQVIKIENLNFVNNLNDVKKQNSYFAKINKSLNLLNLLSPNIDQTNKELCLGLIRNLFDLRNSSDLSSLKTLRRLLCLATSNNVFADKKDNLQSYLVVINQELIPFGLKDGDMVQIISNKFGRTLWVHSQSRFSGNNLKEVLVGPNSDVRTKNGAQLFKICCNVHSCNSLGFS